MKTPRWEPIAEALGVFLAVMVYIWRLRLDYPWLAFLLLALIIGTQVARREGPCELGFGWHDTRVAFGALIPWVVAAAAVLWVLGMALGTLRPMRPRFLWGGLAAYILWGLLQQYLLNAFLLKRLIEWAGPLRAALMAAVLFSLVHLPNWFLMAVTLAGGYLAARAYLRYRSLWVLGLAHGILAFILFLVVPDSISAHFLIGPRYLLDVYGTYPELLL